MRFLYFILDAALFKDVDGMCGLINISDSVDKTAKRSLLQGGRTRWGNWHVNWMTGAIKLSQWMKIMQIYWNEKSVSTQLTEPIDGIGSICNDGFSAPQYKQCIPCRICLSISFVYYQFNIMLRFRLNMHLCLSVLHAMGGRKAKRAAQTSPSS